MFGDPPQDILPKFGLVLKDPTSRQNFDDTPRQIPTLILTLRHIKKGCYSNTTLIFLDLVPKGKSNSNSLGLA